MSGDAIECAKRNLYDSFGSALGGTQQHDVQVKLDDFKAMGGAQTCTVFGSGFKTDPAQRCSTRYASARWTTTTCQYV